MSWLPFPQSRQPVFRTRAFSGTRQALSVSVRFSVEIKEKRKAGAIDFFGRRYRFPPALSGHQTYFVWGPRGYSGNCLIVLNDTKLQQWPDGQPEVFRTEVPDEVKFNQPVTHVVKTIGDKPLRNIVIELKPY